MARILIVTNPAHDVLTSYLDAWTSKVVEAAMKQPDTQVFELREQAANKNELMRVIAENKPQLIILNGHGNAEAIGGYNDEVLIRCNDNEACVSGAIVHMLSCKTGRSLGPRCIEVGGLAYIGYKENFELAHQNKMTRDECLRDDIAAMILDPAFEAVLALVEGATAEEAFRRSQEKYKEVLRALVTVGNTEFNTSVGSRVFHNLNCQLQLGTNVASF